MKHVRFKCFSSGRLRLLMVAFAALSLVFSVALMGEDATSASPWPSFLRTGHLAHSQRLSL